MKLRLEDHTLRLRLSEEEVREFARTGRLGTSTPLGPGPDDVLRYELERSATVKQPALQYAAGRLTILVPAALAEHWTSTEENGFSQEIETTPGQKLRILVEKDLGCRH